jgi:hypothetical protein
MKMPTDVRVGSDELDQLWCRARMPFSHCSYSEVISNISESAVQSRQMVNWDAWMVKLDSQ